MCLLLIPCAGTKLSRRQGGGQGDVDTLRLHHVILLFPGILNIIDQSNVIVFIRAYWPRDNNFYHVTFYCGWQKTFRSMQWPLS